ncbi:MAG: methionyl-tRNA formyltransferase [Clostridia bacterium]|nr:methionyl-tRNA formyltransferase [Clostridia bacterium]
MKVVFLGTPDFAVLPLKAVCETKGVEVAAVICNKDKPFGRKQVLTAPPVKVIAESLGIPVFQYDKIRVEGVDDLKRLAPDLMITCAFGQILSQEILDIPKHGVINIHASLLPKYRGASPIHYAILNGEKTTGITIMKTDIGIDTGDILLQKSLQIGDNETCGELFERLSVLGAECIKDALSLIMQNSAVYTPQIESKATFTKIITKEQARIDWTKSADDIVNLVRAFNPAPVAFTTLNGEPFKIYSAEKCDITGNAGEILFADKTLIVGAGEKSVSLLKVCKAGGKPMQISDFLRGNKLSTGTKLG